MKNANCRIVFLFNPCAKTQANFVLFFHRNNLATLAMYSVPTAIAPAKSGDSMTLNLSAWLGLPAIPFIVSLIAPCAQRKGASLFFWFFCPIWQQALFPVKWKLEY